MRAGRRAFLLGAGGFALGLPALECLHSPKKARAGGEGPRRFVVVSHKQGTIRDLWVPQGGERDFTLSPLLAPLAPFRERMLIIDGLHNMIAPALARSDGHLQAELSLLTCDVTTQNLDEGGEILPYHAQLSGGDAAHASIDQVIAARVGADAPLRSIDLGVGNYGEDPPTFRVRINRKSWAGPDDPVTSILEPLTAYSYLFSGGQHADPAAAARLLARRLSVLDAVGDNFTHLRARLGHADRRRLDAHAEKVRALERRLQETPACARESPDLPEGYDFRLDDHISAPLMAEMLVLGLSCGLADVGSLMFIDGQTARFRWIDAPPPLIPPPPAGDTSDEPEIGYSGWHDMVHRGQGPGPLEPGLVAGFSFYSQVFADLLRVLDETPDAGGGSLLDSTALLWISEFGRGSHHWPFNLPVVLAGDLGDIEMGRFIDLKPAVGAETHGGAYATNQLYVSLLRAFGGDDAAFGRVGHVSVPGHPDGWSAVIPSGPLPL